VDNLNLLFKNKNVLVTGHTGFKGAWLCLWLIKLGANVTGLSIDIPSKPSHFTTAKIDDKIRDERLNIRDGEALKVLIKDVKPDFVFHLAAQALVRPSYISPVETWQTNAFGTINLLESLRQYQHPCVAIFITSDKCYDNKEWVWGYRETDALGGPDPYSGSKGAAELAIRSYVKSFFPDDGPIKIGVGRAGNVIGGGDWARDRIVPDCVRACSKNKILEMRNPKATRPWQHVLEPLSGYLNLAFMLSQNNKIHGEAFNFGPPDQQNNSVGELVEVMSQNWDKVRWKDVSSLYGGPYESKLLKLNCDKAIHELNWHTVWDFKTTVYETVAWYREYYENQNKVIDNFSLLQIDKYIGAAKSQGLLWAQ